MSTTGNPFGAAQAMAAFNQMNARNPFGTQGQQGLSKDQANQQAAQAFSAAVQAANPQLDFSKRDFNNMTGMVDPYQQAEDYYRRYGTGMPQTPRESVSVDPVTGQIRFDDPVSSPIAPQRIGDGPTEQQKNPNSAAAQSAAFLAATATPTGSMFSGQAATATPTGSMLVSPQQAASRGSTVNTRQAFTAQIPTLGGFGQMPNLSQMLGAPSQAPMTGSALGQAKGAFPSTPGNYGGGASGGMALEGRYGVSSGNSAPFPLQGQVNLVKMAQGGSVNNPTRFPLPAARQAYRQMPAAQQLAALNLPTYQSRPMTVPSSTIAQVPMVRRTLKQDISGYGALPGVVRKADGGEITRSRAMLEQMPVQRFADGGYNDKDIQNYLSAISQPGFDLAAEGEKFGVSGVTSVNDLLGAAGQHYGVSNAQIAQATGIPDFIRAAAYDNPVVSASPASSSSSAVSSAPVVSSSSPATYSFPTGNALSSIVNTYSAPSMTYDEARDIVNTTVGTVPFSAKSPAEQAKITQAQNIYNTMGQNVLFDFNVPSGVVTTTPALGNAASLVDKYSSQPIDLRTLTADQRTALDAANKAINTATGNSLFYDDFGTGKTSFGTFNLPKENNSTTAAALADGILTLQERKTIEGILRSSSDQGDAVIFNTMKALDPTGIVAKSFGYVEPTKVEPTKPVITTTLPPSVTYPTFTDYNDPITLPAISARPVTSINAPDIDTEFRNSAQRTWDPVSRSFTYSPPSKLTAATGSGLSWTPPGVTSRPRTLWNVRMNEIDPATGLPRYQEGYDEKTGLYTAPVSASTMNAEYRKRLLAALGSAIGDVRLHTTEYYRLLTQARAGAFGEPGSPGFAAAVTAAANAMVAARGDTPPPKTDTITGGTGNDTVTGGTRNDTVTGGTRNDTIQDQLAGGGP
jgi:hypothetical protein